MNLTCKRGSCIRPCVFKYCGMKTQLKRGTFSTKQFIIFCVSSSVPSAGPGPRGQALLWGLYSCPPPSRQVSALSSRSRPTGSSSPSTPNLPSSRYVHTIICQLLQIFITVYGAFMLFFNDFDFSLMSFFPRMHH